jgi:hypothetical protein
MILYLNNRHLWKLILQNQDSYSYIDYRCLYDKIFNKHCQNLTSKTLSINISDPIYLHWKADWSKFNLHKKKHISSELLRWSVFIFHTFKTSSWQNKIDPLNDRIQYSNSQAFPLKVWISIGICHGHFYVQWFEMRGSCLFVVIDEIIDYHCL